MCDASVSHSEQHGFSVLLRPDPAEKGPTSISIRHTSRPYVIDGVDVSPLLSGGMGGNAMITELMQQYLLWLHGLSEAGEIPPIGFRYAATVAEGVETLHVLRYSAQHDAWCTSYDFVRSLPIECGIEGAGEHTLVMLAAAPALARIDQAGRDDGALTDVSYMHRRGVRIVAHVDTIQNAPGEAQQYRLRMTSMSAYLEQGQTMTLGSSMALEDCCEAGEEVDCVDPQGNGVDYAREPASSSATGLDGVYRTLRGRRPNRPSSVLNQYMGAQAAGGVVEIEGCKSLRCDDKPELQPLDYLKLRRSPFVTEDIEAVPCSKSVAGAAIASHTLPVPAAATSASSAVPSMWLGWTKPSRSSVVSGDGQCVLRRCTNSAASLIALTSLPLAYPGWALTPKNFTCSVSAENDSVCNWPSD